MRSMKSWKPTRKGTINGKIAMGEAISMGDDNEDSLII